MIQDARGPTGPIAPPAGELPPWKRRLRAWSRLLAVIAIVTVPFWGRALLRTMDFFRVRRVEIEGVRYAAPDEIVSRLRVDTTVSIWDDVSPLEARVAEHPQVREARITRKFRALPPEDQRRLTSGIPVGRPGSGEDMANAVCFLASPKSAYVTGEILAVAGGA